MHLLGYVCMSEEYIVCVYTVQLVQKLQEQTDRSSLHSGAAGKPLIKQRERNWPSWWYNLYTWNTQNENPHTHIHTHTHVFTYVHNPPKMSNEHKAMSKQQGVRRQNVHAWESVCRRETISKWARKHFHLTISPSSSVSSFCVCEFLAACSQHYNSSSPPLFHSRTCF